MLKVDLKLGTEELSGFISVRCSSFGNVKSVQIHLDAKPFAIVEMATRIEALQLGAFFERTIFGNCVLLYLEDENNSRSGPSFVMPPDECQRTLSTLSCWLI